jgi:hypothetical protein
MAFSLHIQLMNLVIEFTLNMVKATCLWNDTSNKGLILDNIPPRYSEKSIIQGKIPHINIRTISKGKYLTNVKNTGSVHKIQIKLFTNNSNHIIEES